MVGDQGTCPKAAPGPHSHPARDAHKRRHLEDPQACGTLLVQCQLSAKSQRTPKSELRLFPQPHSGWHEGLQSLRESTLPSAISPCM